MTVKREGGYPHIHTATAVAAPAVSRLFASDASRPRARRVHGVKYEQSERREMRAFNGKSPSA